MRTDDPPPARRTERELHGAVGRHVQVSRVNVRVPLSEARVRQLAERALKAGRCSSAMIAITFVDRASMARLNRAHVGHAGATDIVTLEHDTGTRALVVGDIYIAPAVARENARVLGAPVREEIARLVIHGVLHALGWTHPEDEARTASPMWQRQESILAAARRAGEM